MRTILKLTALALGLCALPLISATAQNIPNPRLCPEVVDEWLAHAQEFRQLGGCGLEQTNSYLSTDRKVQTDICLNNSDVITESRTNDIRDTLSNCRYCRAYSDSAISAAKDNILYGCGFTGDRWTTSASDHFNWCMNLRDCQQICVFFFYCHNACLDRKSLQEIYSDRETSARTQAIAECRISNPEPRSCKSCHARSPNAPRTAPVKPQERKLQ
jgi:hypothetical protein